MKDQQQSEMADVEMRAYSAGEEPVASYAIFRLTFDAEAQQRNDEIG